MKPVQTLGLLPLLLSCQTLYAETDTASHRAAPIAHADVLQWLWALLAVLAIFAALVWLVRKSGALSLHHKNQLAVIAGLSLGVRERLVLVKVGDKQLLLGISPGGMDKLLELEGDQRLFQTPDNVTSEATFADQLQRLLKGRPHA